MNKEAYDFEESLAAEVLDFLVALDNAVDTDIVEEDQVADFAEQHWVNKVQDFALLMGEDMEIVLSMNLPVKMKNFNLISRKKNVHVRFKSLMACILFLRVSYFYICGQLTGKNIKTCTFLHLSTKTSKWNVSLLLIFSFFCFIRTIYSNLFRCHSHFLSTTYIP